MAKFETVPQPKGQIVRDPELVAMQKINRILEKLDERAKFRVVSWLKDKLQFPLLDPQEAIGT